jgi:uncharacterized membrane protein
MLDVLFNNPGDNLKPKRLSKLRDKSDKPLKSFLKSLSWRVVGTLDTIIISYFITGKFSFAVSIGGIEVITKTILYYFHERLWVHIHGIRLNILKKSNRKRDEDYRTEKNTQGENSPRFIKNPDFAIRRTNIIYHQFWN